MDLFRVLMPGLKEICFFWTQLSCTVCSCTVLKWDKFPGVITLHPLAAENEITSYFTRLLFNVFMRYLLSSTSCSHTSQSGYSSQSVNRLVMPKLIVNLKIGSSLLIAMCSYITYLTALKFLFTLSKMVVISYGTSGSFLLVI